MSSVNSCRCSIHRPNTGRYTYSKYPNRIPLTGTWCQRYKRPDLFVFKTNGSYLGRNARTPKYYH